MARRLTDIVAMQVRLPEGLRRQLVGAAEANARSLNSEILWRLGQSFGPQEQRLVDQSELEEKRETEFRERLLQNEETIRTIVAGMRKKER